MGDPTSAPPSRTSPPTSDPGESVREHDPSDVDALEPDPDGFEPPPEEASLEARCFAGSQEACDQLGH